MLDTLGLSRDAELVYQTMVSAPTAGVADVAGTLGLPESRVRDGLDELVRFTLARESRDEPGKLRMVSPDIALSTLLHREEQELAQRQHELAAKKVAITTAVAEYANLQPNLGGNSSERLVGLDRIQSRLEVLARDLRAECLSVMPGGAQSQASLDASRPLDRDALERGISILTLYQDSARHDLATASYARWLTDLGGQVRTAPMLPPRMLIFDREVAIIPIDPANTKLGALCTYRCPPRHHHVHGSECRRVLGGVQPGRDTLAVGAGVVRLYDLATGRLRTTLTDTAGFTNGAVTTIAFSPDANLLAAGTQNGTLLPFDLATGHLRAVPDADDKYHPAGSAVAFSPNGKTLVVGDGDGAVRLYDPSTGLLRTTLADIDLTSVAFSPDGQNLAAGDGDGQVVVWPTGVFADPYQLLCTEVGQVSAEDWISYAPSEQEPPACASS